jgi:hypothetical protein
VGSTWTQQIQGPDAFAPPEIAANQAFLETPQRFLLLFHNVFHRCGNLGGQTERFEATVLHWRTRRDASAL